MALAGVAARRKSGETVSGDAGTYFKRPDGKLYLLLCDGMGSGPDANRESTLAIRLLEQLDFDNYLVAIKSSDVFTTVEAYRLAAEQTDCPFHLGVTEAGTARMGLVKSAAAFGALLADGIGDTIRVSLTADPVEEVRAARDILRGLGLEKNGPRLVS